MKKMHVVLVLDESRSMLPHKQAVLSGTNEYIKSIRDGEREFDLKFTLVKFNGSCRETLFNKVCVDCVPEVTNKDYSPRSVTPLYDAIGETMERFKGKKRVLFVIQTDGLENDSRKYNRQMIYDMIKRNTEAGWQFAFLGADQDAWLEGLSLGIPKGSTLSYSGTDTYNAFGELARTSRVYLCTAVVTSDFFDETDIRQSSAVPETSQTSVGKSTTATP